MERKDKIIYYINGALLALLIVATVLFLTLDCSHYITKTIASALFVLTGAINLFYVIWAEKVSGKKLTFGILLLIGLVLACAGDILLIDYFVLGAIFFASGHLLFLSAFIVLSGVNVRDAIICVVLFVLCYLLISLYKGFNFEGMRLLVTVYALVISFMLGKAFSNIFKVNNKLVYVLILVGAGLFFLSDVMLMFYMFAGRVRIYDLICVSTYYPGEFVLALSILAVGKFFTEKKK